MQAWIEENLPSNHPFGVFVDVHVVLELILVGHTNIQAATMEQSQKLSLEVDKAFILKTFENKLPMLLGRPSTVGVSTKMVTSTKDTWLPGLTSYGQWETPSRLGGMKVVTQQQLGTVE
eukprot:12963727-Ditylum_brightwellii.AAC.1